MTANISDSVWMIFSVLKEIARERCVCVWLSDLVCICLYIYKIQLMLYYLCKENYCSYHSHIHLIQFRCAHTIIEYTKHKYLHTFSNPQNINISHKERYKIYIYIITSYGIEPYLWIIFKKGLKNNNTSQNNIWLSSETMHQL